VEQPERVQDLAVTQVGRGLEISFTKPQVAADGERLSKPIEVELFRAVTPPGQPPPQAPPTQSPWLALAPADVTRYTQGDKVGYTHSFSEQEFSALLGSTFSFAARSLTRGFRRRALESELSNVAQAVLLDVSGPPEHLEARPTEKAIELGWAPPGQSLAGHPLSDLAGYRVSRREVGKPDSLRVLGETPAAAYSDPDFQFGHTYAYKVRAIFKQGDHRAESDEAAFPEITPQDVFPPAAPAALTAVYAAGTVEILWSANTEPDLAGYNLYRRGETGGRERLNPELVSTPIYRDSTAEPGHKYFYQVTAVDFANNESRPSAEVEVESR